MPCRPGWPWKRRSSCLCLPKLGLKTNTHHTHPGNYFSWIISALNPSGGCPCFWASPVHLCAITLAVFLFCVPCCSPKAWMLCTFLKNDTCMHMRHGVLVEVKQLAWSGSLLPSRSWGLNSVISLDPQAWQQVLLPCFAISLAPRMPFNFLYKVLSCLSFK